MACSGASIGATAAVRRRLLRGRQHPPPCAAAQGGLAGSSLLPGRGGWAGRGKLSLSLSLSHPHCFKTRTDVT
jgi:hypothetical protein